MKLKLRDLAAMLREYLDWLAERGLQDADCLLDEASALFKKTNVDTILVTSKGKPFGMLDIQDLKA